jgi:hypothetical protein
MVSYRRRKKEEGRRKKEEGRRKKEEGPLTQFILPFDPSNTLRATLRSGTA